MSETNTADMSPSFHSNVSNECDKNVRSILCVSSKGMVGFLSTGKNWQQRLMMIRKSSDPYSVRISW